MAAGSQGASQELYGRQKKLVVQLSNRTISKQCKQQVVISVIQLHLMPDRRLTDHPFVEARQVIEGNEWCNVMREMIAKSARRQKQVIKPCWHYLSRERHGRTIDITINDWMLCVAPHKETKVTPGRSRNQPIKDKQLGWIKSQA